MIINESGVCCRNKNAKSDYMKYLKSIFALFFVMLLGHMTVSAQTTITGDIYSSTVWTLSGSPYTIANSIVVFPGGSLTIDPGVTVIFNSGVSIDMRGQFKAIGTPTDRIYFTSGNGGPNMGAYQGIVVTGSAYAKMVQMAFCNISYAYNFMRLMYSNGTYTFNNCYFYNNHFGLGDSPAAGTVSVDSCRFESNFLGVNQNYPGTITVSNSVFINNTNGANADNILNCTFANNTLIAAQPWKTMQHCEVYNSNLGVFVDMVDGTTLTNNYIHNNVTGIELKRYYYGPTVNFSDNKICTNSIWNIQYDYNANGDISGNCFCLSDSASIRAKLRDGYISPSYGVLTFSIDNACSAGVTYVEPVTANKAMTVRVFPNPMCDHATMEFDIEEGHVYSIDVTDVGGRLMQRLQGITTGSVQVSRNNLTPGMYYLKLKNESEVLYTGKLLVE